MGLSPSPRPQSKIPGYVPVNEHTNARTNQQTHVGALSTLKFLPATPTNEPACDESTTCRTCDDLQSELQLSTKSFASHVTNLACLYSLWTLCRLRIVLLLAYSTHLHDRWTHNNVYTSCTEVSFTRRDVKLDDVIAYRSIYIDYECLGWR